MGPSAAGRREVQQPLCVQQREERCPERRELAVHASAAPVGVDHAGLRSMASCCDTAPGVTPSRDATSVVVIGISSARRIAARVSPTSSSSTPSAGARSASHRAIALGV